MTVPRKQREFGTYEAKTHLTRLLARVAKGDEITITRHGVPIARLVPVRSQARLTAATAIAELRKFRQHHRRGKLSLRKMIREGRR